MKNLLQQILLLVCVFGIAACGGGGSSGSGSTPVAVASSSPLSNTSSVASIIAVSSSSEAQSSSSSLVPSSSSATTRPTGQTTTTYSVTVDVPSTFSTVAAEGAATTLTANHFAVIGVDLAGNILEKIQLYDDDVVFNNDGTWFVSFPSSPRLDYLIVVDVTKSIQLTVGSNIHQNGLVYAPITANTVDIDVGSTAGYSNFLEGLGGTGSFASQNFDPTTAANITAVDEMLNGIQEIVAQQTLTQFTTVSDALASLKPQVSAVVAQEVVNIKTPVAGTAASLIRDEGGMFTYHSFGDDAVLDLNYDALIGTTVLASYHYNGSAFVVADTTSTDQDLVLSQQGWVVPSNGTQVITYNDDGSVTTKLMGAEGVNIKLEAQQAFDLSGRNIRDFLKTDVDTQPLASSIDASKTFASGAKGYRIKSSFVDTLYILSVDAATDSVGVCDTTDKNNGVLASTLGGNCNALGSWGVNQLYSGAITSLTDIFSADVTPDMDGFKAVTLFDPVVVQLVNDSAQTARFYIQTAVTADADTAQTILIGTGTWSQDNLPYLTEDATAIQVKMTSPVNDINYLLPNLQYLLVKQAGFVRLVLGIDDNTMVEESFNGVANTNILDALVPGTASSESPPTVIRSSLRQLKIRQLQ